MRGIVQRVVSARLSVDGQEVSRISAGILVYASTGARDGKADVEYMAKKIAGLRLFSDEEGKFNLDLGQVGGEVLLVSNFTIHGDVRKGRRPSFAAAAEPERAAELLSELAAQIRREGIKVAEGRFGAHMQVESVNDGPVNILLDSGKVF